MKKNGHVKTLCLLSTIVFISCTGTNQTTESNSNIPPTQIVGEVGAEKITYDELRENFVSGSINQDFSLEDLKDFLPIYLDYKAKILSAKEDGYFEDERILSEYELYSKQAAYSYWLENKIRPTLFDEFKAKYGIDLKSSHLLIALGQNAAPGDTLEVYNKLIEARNKFLAGTHTMAELDPEYSSTRQGRSMGGDLPWFSLGSTVKEFEDVLFSLEVGEISMPFRTQFGYHVVLLEDKRVREPSRNVSHIFIRKNQGASPLDSAYSKLASGANWSEIVREYTQDTPSAANDGKIGWINYGGRYDPAFIDSVMNLDVNQPFSKPVSSIYGYHIFKVDSVQTFSSETDKDAFLMKELEDSRSFRKSNSFVIEWLQKYFTSKDNEELLISLAENMKNMDSTRVEDFTSEVNVLDAEIYKFDKQSYSANDFVEYLKEAGKGPYTSNYVEAWFVDFKTHIVDSRLTELTLREFPEFENQTENYRRGLVVYQVNEDSVWSTATIDTSKLVQIYENNPSEYMFDTRYYYHLVTSSRDSSLQKAISFVNSGNSPDSIRANGISVGVVSDSTGSFQGEPFDKLAAMQENTFSEIFDYNSRKGVFYLNAILPERAMTFDEAFNRLVSEYQPQREEKWLNRLRSVYNIKIHQDNLEKAYQKEMPSE